jgi:hypothetical protein
MERGRLRTLLRTGMGFFPSSRGQSTRIWLGEWSVGQRFSSVRAQLSLLSHEQREEILSVWTGTSGTTLVLHLFRHIMRQYNLTC